MTREEAVSIIEERIHVTEYVNSSYVDCVDIEALRMAIKALRQPEPCKDTISRQAAIDALHMYLMYRMGTDSNKKRLDEWINNLPSAEPERKTGKWIYHSDWEADGECGYECSECGMGSDVDYDYCMRCGADMREGQDG